MDREAEIAADSGEVREVGGSAVTEAEGFAFMDLDSVEAVMEYAPGELRGSPEMEFVEGKNEDEVDTGFSEERELVRQRRDERKMSIREEDVCGMRIEGDCDGTNAECASAFDDGGEDHAVSAMHAIEVANSDDRRCTG